MTKRGEIYNFARTNINHGEFCGGCFSPDGRTFFVNQQGGDRAPSGDDATDGLTFAIWGPFGEKHGD